VHHPLDTFLNPCLLRTRAAIGRHLLTSQLYRSSYPELYRYCETQEA